MAELTRVLFVDDDENLLKAARRIMRKEINLEVASSGKDALQKLETSGPFDVLVSDQNMPSMKGVTLLAEAATRWPLTVRIMLTGNDDQGTTISAVNDGKVFRFVRKPCQPLDLLDAIRDASKHHALLAGEKALLEQTLSGSVKVLTDVIAISKPELFKTVPLVQKWARLLSTKLKGTSPWELNLAAMLYPLGAVALPDAIVQKCARGATLDANEQAIVDQSPRAARDLIKNIPRLEGVANAIYYSRKGFDGSGYPQDDVKGRDLPPVSRVLRILVDLVEARVKSEQSIGDGLKKLTSKPNLYDLDLLEIVANTLRDEESGKAGHVKVKHQLPADELLEGDILVKPITDEQGRALLTAGSELTTVIIKRLAHLQETGLFKEKVHVSRWGKAA